MKHQRPFPRLCSRACQRLCPRHPPPYAFITWCDCCYYKMCQVYYKLWSKSLEGSTGIRKFGSTEAPAINTIIWNFDFIGTEALTLIRVNCLDCHDILVPHGGFQDRSVVWRILEFGFVVIHVAKQHVCNHVGAALIGCQRWTVRRPDSQIVRWFALPIQRSVNENFSSVWVDAEAPFFITLVYWIPVNGPNSPIFQVFTIGESSGRDKRCNIAPQCWSSTTLTVSL